MANYIVLFNENIWISTKERCWDYISFLILTLYILFIIVFLLTFTFMAALLRKDQVKFSKFNSDFSNKFFFLVIGF